MIIPEFKPKTVPVLDMENYIIESSEEAKTFKKILTAVKEYKSYLRVEELVLLLEYKEKAEEEVFLLLVNIGKASRTDYDYYTLKEDFGSIKEFVTFHENPISNLKYYVIKQLIEEIDLIIGILTETNNLNYESESVFIANIKDLQEKLEN